MTQKHTKRALLSSVLALLVCVTMLIGTTFAWFTDSVTSGGNKIVAGKLKIDLIHARYENNTGSPVKTSLKDNPDHKIFDYSLWEPGYTQIEYLQVINKGNLHFKYELRFTSQSALTKLADVIEVYTGYPTAAYGKDREQALKDLNYIGTIADIMAKGGRIFQANTGGMDLQDGAPVLAYTIALHMKESAGNEYQGLSLFEGIGGFNVTLVATQMENEFDSFGPNYDAFADYDGEITNATSLKAAFANGGTYKVLNEITVDEAVNVPAGVEVNLDMNGKTITGTKGRDADNNRIHVIVNNGILTIKDGTVKSAGNDGGSAICNNAGATLTIEDVTLYGAPQSDPVYEAGVSKPFPSYAVNNYGNAVVNGATVKSYHGAIATGGDGVTVINDADIDVGLGQSTGITSYIIYSYDNAQVTVNDGKFAFTKQEIYVNGGNTFCELGTNPIIINGGNYTGTSFSSSAGREYVIKGGTFDQDPSAYVAEGYTVDIQYTNNNKKLYVVSQKTNTNKNAEDIIIDEGANVELKNDNIQGIVTNNGGNLTIADTTVHNISDHSYGGALYDGSYTVFKNATITNATGGGIAVRNSEAVFESGVVDIQNTKSRHMFYVGTDNGFSKLTIKDGTFNLKNKTTTSSYLVAQNAGAVIIIEGGNFEAASSKKAPVQELNGGEVIIKGGTFKWDPSAWLAEGYQAIENSGVWTVSAK